MKPISEVRRENLVEIIKSKFDNNQEKLAAFLGKAPNTISRCVNVNSSQPRNIGNGLAREIEAKLNLERNWMDTQHEGTITIGQAGETGTARPINFIGGGSDVEPEPELDLDAVEFAFQAFRENIDWSARENGGIAKETAIFDLFYRYYLIAKSEGNKEPSPTSPDLAMALKLNNKGK